MNNSGGGSRGDTDQVFDFLSLMESLSSSGQHQMPAAGAGIVSVGGAAGPDYAVASGEMSWPASVHRRPSASVWPSDYFHIATAPGIPINLGSVMADKQEIWDNIVAEHQLEPTPYHDISSWAFGDAVFGWDYDLIADYELTADGSKARRYGFHDYVDTEQMFRRIFDDMRSRSIIPPR
jgi:hypothetical protein